MHRLQDYNSSMKTPFPGMDPYLEHPALWPDVHNSLIAALRDAISPLVSPRYYVALERRTYLLKPDDIVFIGRPDIAVATSQPPAPAATASASFAGVLEVDLPMTDEVGEDFLEIREVKTGTLVTLMELLSPANKLHEEGREQYERKRADVLRTRTSLVEIDLLRAGEPMAVVGPQAQSDYRILVSRGWLRPRAQLYAFTLRQPIPQFPLPLLLGDEEPLVDLNTVLHELYGRARFDLRLDYDEPPVPPLRSEDAAWAQTLPRPDA
jgi:hypothetical protein